LRFVVFGAGAVGGTIGARLFQSGHDVQLVARGAHASALLRSGLRLRIPQSPEVRLPIPVFEDPSDLTLQGDEIVFLAVKSQDSKDALESLATASQSDRLSIVCAQNGVENERLALRMYSNVYSMCVQVPGTLVEPGCVATHSRSPLGILDVGRYPVGVDSTCEEIAGALSEAGFWSQTDPSIMQRKFTKLLVNLHNGLEAICGFEARGSTIAEQARAEAVECFRAAGIAFDEPEEAAARVANLQILPIDGVAYRGSSTWQSVARGLDSTEVDYLNGEVVMLGRMHGVPTPVNSLIQRTVRERVASRQAAGSLTLEEFSRALASLRPYPDADRDLETL